MRELNENEKAVLECLVKAWNIMLKLEKIHPQDQREFATNIHALQNIIMSRPTVEVRNKKIDKNK